MGHKYDWASIPSYIPKVMKAFPLTIEILLLSLLFSLIIGALVAVGALSKNKVARAVTKGWISFMRGIPTLVLIFLLYLGLPQLMNALGVNMSGISKTTYIVACLALSTSANMAEMMRAAYLSVNKGQREAAYSVGMKPVSYTHLRAHETDSYLVCRLLLEKKKTRKKEKKKNKKQKITTFNKKTTR